MHRRGFLGCLAALAGTSVVPIPVVDTVPVKLLPAIIPIKYTRLLGYHYLPYELLEDSKNWNVDYIDETIKREIYSG